MTVPLADEMRSEPPGLAWALGRLAQDKDAQAWATLLVQAGPDIQRLAMRLSGNTALAEDAVQEALMLIRDHAARFVARTADADDDARRWILGVTTNASLQLLRRHHRQTSRDVRAGQLAAHAATPTADPGERTERADDSVLLRRELAALPTAYGQVLTLHYFGGQDYPALASHLQVPVNTVRTRVHRGLKALRERLTRCGLALSLAALSGSLTNLGAATVGGAATVSTSAVGLLTSTTVPSTSFTIASGGFIMATALSTALVAIVAVAVVPLLSAQEPRPQPAVVPVVQTVPAGVPDPAPVPKPSATAAALEQRITFEFQDTPIIDVWRFLKQVSGVSIIVDPGVALDGTITLKVKDMRLRDAVRWISELGNVAWQDAGTHIRITKKGVIAPAVQPPVADALNAGPALAQLEQEVTLDFQDTDLVDVVSFIQRITAMTIVIDPKVVAANPPPVTLRVEQMKLRFVLDFIAKLTGLAWKFHNDALFLTVEDGKEPAPARARAPAPAPASAPAPAKPVRRGADDF